MEKLGLNECLRYGLSGIVALLTLVFTYPQTTTWLFNDNKLVQAYIVAGLVLLVGILIYSFHRVILYPIIYRIISKRPHSLPWKFSDKEIKFEVKRLKKHSEDKNFYKSGFDEWSSRIHFLYCSAWSILITLILGFYIKPCEDLSVKPFIFFLVICLLTFLMALFDDIHAIKIEKEALNQSD